MQQPYNALKKPETLGQGRAPEDRPKSRAKQRGQLALERYQGNIEVSQQLSETPGNLTSQSQSQTPSPAVDEITAVVDQTSAQNTEGHKPLEQDVHGTSKVGGSNLSEVHGHHL